MLITKTSALTGISHTKNLDITQEELDQFSSGVLAKDAFPRLTPDEREFIINGILQEEWNQFVA
jgi:hypothetical protein